MNEEAQRALFTALAEAIADTAGVVRKAQGNGYMYAKAENVIAEADRVMAPRGLIVIPGPSSVSQVAQTAKGGDVKPVIILQRQFTLAHKDGGTFPGGEICIALGLNIGGTPPQCTNSANTTALAYYLKDLLRMPRQDIEDVDDPRNQARHREEPEERAPARPAIAPPTQRKVARVLDTVTKIRSVADYEKARERWDGVLAERGAPLGDGSVDDCGYTDAEVETVKAALAEARKRVGL